MQQLVPIRQYFDNMTYVRDCAVTAGSVGVVGASYVFNLNSLFQPDNNSGTGPIKHKPLYYNEFAALYTNYVVTYVRVQLDWNSSSAMQNLCIAMFRSSSDTATIVGAEPEYMKEQRQASTCIVGNNGEEPAKTMNYQFSIRALDGLWGAVTNDINRYGAVTGANPSAIPKMEIATANLYDDSNTTVQCLVTITFSGYWWGRKQVAAST